MKNTKRILSLILSVVMLSGCIGVSAAYPTELLSVPTTKVTNDDTGNGSNDNSAYTFKHDIAYKYGDGVTGASFVLLDTDESGNCLVATEKFLGAETKTFDDDTSNGWQYSVTDESNIGWWVNTYLTSSGGARGLYYLGEDIYKNLVEKEWKTEASALQNTSEQTFNAKAVIPSYTEYMHYRDKLNSSNASMNVNYSIWLRTPSNFSDDTADSMKHLRIYYTGTRGELSSTIPSSGTCSRQLFFWVKSDFFKGVKLSNIGSEAGKMILESGVTKDELKAVGYNAGELKQYFGIEPDAVSVITDVELSVNIAAPGGTASVTYTATPETDSNTVAWYTCDADGANPTAISELSGATVTIPSSAGGKNICAGVISGDGTVVYSDPVTVEAPLTTYSENVLNFGMNKDNNADYMFSDNWTDFIMLEAAEDGSDFLVLADWSAISGNWASKIIKSGTTLKSMDPTVNEYLPNFLNGEYLNYNDSSNSYDVTTHDFLGANNKVKGLPDAVKPYINSNALWRTEKSELGDEYVFKATVTLPSAAELVKHKDKIGYISADNYFTRTGIMGSATRILTYKGNGGLTQSNFNAQYGADGASYIRPVFRLNREFFMNVKLPLTVEETVDPELGRLAVMGSKVKEMLVANFARSELAQAGYSDEELDLIGFKNNEPVVSDVNAQGIASVAQTLTADFDYSDPNNSEKASVEYQWYYADSETGDLNKIKGATAATYEVTEDMLGKYIAVSVRAYNAAGIKSAAVKSGLVGPIAKRADIVVTPVSITNAKAEFTIDNAAADKDMVILYCVYNKDNNSLEHVVKTDIKAVKGKDTYSASSDFEVTANHKVKAMLWDNLDTIRPYAMIELK